MLWLVMRMSCGLPTSGGNWLSALALFVYADGYSFAYVSLPAAIRCTTALWCWTFKWVGLSMTLSPEFVKPSLSEGECLVKFLAG